MAFRFSFKRFKFPFSQPIRTAHGLWTEREGIWVRLVSEEEGSGYGEAAPIVAFGTETIEEIEARCQSFSDPISAEQIDALPPTLGCLRFAFQSARSQMEAATAKRLGGVPETPTGQAYLPIAALLPAGKAALEKAMALCDAGFRTFKWKVGVGDLGDELGLLDELLSKLPSGAKLRLDANGAWNGRQAQRWLERAADRPIEFIEQPVAADSREVEDLMLGLAGDYPTPLALDESIATGSQIARWLDLGWSGYLVIKPALLGNAEEVFARIKKSNTKVVFSSALETAVGARAALSVALRQGAEGRAIGFGVWPLFADTRLNGPSLAPFIRQQDVDRLDAASAWNALT